MSPIPDQAAYDRVIQNKQRLAVLRELALIDAAEEPFFDRLTKLASQALGTPISLVSLVGASYQFFKAAYGLPEPVRSARQTPLSHSFCQHVVASGEPLIVEDAREHPLLHDNLAIPDLNVIGYLGFPLHTSAGQEMGSFCVIDSKPHAWSDEDVSTVRAFADLVNAELDARAAAHARGALDEHLAAMGRLLDALSDAVVGGLNGAELRAALGTLTSELRQGPSTPPPATH